MRLIDADALKGDLTRFYTGEVTARNLIDEQPTVGGWISVKDRMPRTGNVYLITLNPPATMLQTMEAYLRHDGTWWRGKVSLMSEYVTHWMPLPEPPEEVTEDV